MDKYIVSESLDIRSAFKHMDKNKKKFIVIVNKLSEVHSIVTDGDFRRAIWSAISFKENIKAISTKNFSYLSEKYDDDEITQLFESTNIDQIPIIKDHLLVDVIFRDDFSNSKKHITNKKMNLPVVIMAGGFGKRLDPFTRILPKALVPIGEKTILEIIMSQFSVYSISRFMITLNDKSKMIMSYFSDNDLGYKIDFVEENKPLGTAGSLKLLSKKIRETFFVSNCDIIIKSNYYDILKFHKKRKNMITLVGSMMHFQIPYGVCKIENGGDLISISEKPEYDFLTNTGLYLIEPEVLQLIPKDSYFDMTDLIKIAQKNRHRIGVFPVSEKSWIDIGQWELFNKAIESFDNGDL